MFTTCLVPHGPPRCSIRGLKFIDAGPNMSDPRAGRYPRLKRAERKKMQKKFKVGDIVTWGLKIKSHRIVEVCEDGVYVDATDSNVKDPHYFVSWTTLLEKDLKYS